MIEIQEAKECSNFLQGRGSFPVLDTLDLDRVHCNGIFTDDNTEIFHFGLFKLAFLRFEVEVVNREDVQDVVYYSAVQRGVVRGMNKDIIHIDHDVAFVDEFAEEVVHH